MVSVRSGGPERVCSPARPPHGLRRITPALTGIFRDVQVAPCRGELGVEGVNRLPYEDLGGSGLEFRTGRVVAACGVPVNDAGPVACRVRRGNSRGILNIPA